MFSRWAPLSGDIFDFPRPLSFLKITLVFLTWINYSFKKPQETNLSAVVREVWCKIPVQPRTFIHHLWNVIFRVSDWLNFESVLSLFITILMGKWYQSQYLWNKKNKKIKNKIISRIFNHYNRNTKERKNKSKVSPWTFMLIAISYPHASPSTSTTSFNPSFWIR